MRPGSWIALAALGLLLLLTGPGALFDAAVLACLVMALLTWRRSRRAAP